MIFLRTVGYKSTCIYIAMYNYRIFTCAANESYHVVIIRSNARYIIPGKSTIIVLCTVLVFINSVY